MNIWIFLAGLLALFTAAVHIVAGQFDPIKPFLQSSISAVQKATLLACWHIVSVVLLLSGCVLAFLGWNAENLYMPLVVYISVSFMLYSLVFIVVGWHFFGVRSVMILPQWVLLLPIGGFGLLGVTNLSI